VTAEELVIAYAEQTAIIRESKAAIKVEMGLSEDEGFCEEPRRQYEASPEESCIRRHLNGYIEPDEMCDSCKVIWPHVHAKYRAKQERAKIMLKINAMGRRLKKRPKETQ